MNARAVTLLLAMTAFSRPAAALDAFEIQVYDAETLPALATGIDLHYNTFIAGNHDVGPEGELPTHRVTHLTLEPAIGLTSWSELGLYLQTAVRPDGSLDYAGAKVRWKARVPRRFAGFGLAANVELSAIPQRYEAGWGSELRPIVDLRVWRLYAAVNPIITMDLEGAAALRPQFEPCGRVLIDVIEGMSAGAEYYGSLGRLDGLLPAAQQAHRLFVVVETEIPLGPVRLGVNAGAGYGFGASERWIVKAIVGVQTGR